MAQITLPDGSVRQYSKSLTLGDIAQDIGSGLAKVALAGKVNGELRDLGTIIDDDCDVSIVTAKDEEGLEIIRHSTAHLLAQVVKQLFPDVQVTIGPVVDNGFYYDFAYDKGFSLDDLELIERRMVELSKAGQPIKRLQMARDEAIDFFEKQGESYKAQIIHGIPKDEPLSLYQQGEFVDLCRGPHVPNSKYIKAFKLMKIAGAYWRGDANNEMLQRIYGTAWADKRQLDAYLLQLKEAERRDHRKIGKQMDLFHMQDEAPGMVFWHPKGWALYQVLQQYMRQQQKKRHYKEINTPEVVDFSLWERSGHAQKFGDDMFSVASEGRDFALKPMNCPCHVQVFNQGLKSYKDLPLRLSEFGSCHRNELSGALHGLMRVRAFVQDDGHIFCTEDQIQSEAAEFIDFLHEVYSKFGFTEIVYRLSTRPESRVGSNIDWDKAEQALAKSLEDKDLQWKESPGEGAFYGPKIEFSLKDSIGRVWQCGTLQVDFSTPDRLGAKYVDENGVRQIPVMLHRALLGTFERFIGILIEHWEGKFPVWFAPVQVILMGITEKHSSCVLKIEEKLKNEGFRVESDLRNEKIGFKIREHTLQRVPYLLIVGENEIKSNTVSVRSQNGDDHGSMPIESFISNYLSQDN